MAKEQAFFAMTDRTRYIQRWSLMRNAQTENLAEHSFQTAVIAHGLAVIRKVRFPELVPRLDEREVMARALYHDLSEVITGDLPTPVKYHDPELQAAYKKIEALASADLLHMLPEDLRTAYAPLLAEPSAAETDPTEHAITRMVKAADKLSAYVKCQSELSQGNQEFREAMVSTLSKLKAMQMPEVEVFLAEFAPAFSLSLDKLRHGDVAPQT